MADFGWHSVGNAVALRPERRQPARAAAQRRAAERHILVEHYLVRINGVAEATFKRRLESEEA